MKFVIKASIVFRLLLGTSSTRLFVAGAEQDIDFVCLDNVEYTLDPRIQNKEYPFNLCNVDGRDECEGSYALTPPEPNGLLNIFLHGTKLPVGYHAKFLRLSAESGFHTLGLAWPSLFWDTQTSADYCAANHPGEKDCLYNMHKQLLVGGVHTGGVPEYWKVPCPAEGGTCEQGECCTGDFIADVPQSGSIVGLVAQAIVEGGYEWTKRFLDKHGNVRWNKVVFSGHSQGANMAAFAAIFLTAKHGSVAGLSLLSGPKGLSEPPKRGDYLAANRWVYYPKEYFVSPKGKAISWSKLKVKAMASEFESSYNRELGGEMADMWMAMGLGVPYDLAFNENDGVVTTEVIPKHVRAVASPLDFASFCTLDAPEDNRGYHPSTAIDCLTPRSDPYPGEGSSNTPAVYAAHGRNTGVWSWLLETEIKMSKGSKKTKRGKSDKKSKTTKWRE